MTHLGVAKYERNIRIVSLTVKLDREHDYMKKIGKYFAIGCVVAFIGLHFSDICGDIISMEYGSACVVGMGMYLCVVVITCTGIIVSKISSSSNEGKSDKKDV